MIDFQLVIEQIRAERQSLQRSDKNLQAEYCYQLVSLLMESERLINGDFWALEYVEEKTDTLESLKKTAQKIKSGEVIGDA